MASLLAIVLMVEVAVAVVNSVGAATINNLLWKIYTAAPIGTSVQMREQRELQQAYLKVRRELTATSSQDEFAKWAKLRRQHDKMFEELEKKKSGIDTSKASFEKTINAVRWFSTSGARWFLPFWFSREPLFWLPHGLFPYYAEWLISFPRAPLGSVSIVSWQLACTGVVALVADAISALLKLVDDARNQAGQKATTKQREAPVEANSKDS
ncbi:CHD5-like protein-domain-containing protein [Coniella lustricola]|uniref:CHD5-like protein-domain-containing protein n=1 Tax=Coniella lustricola TaxID=2025994 RepID=A0A2T2ZX42_9PEZI|nr:CHD5-like protein-domain-containing protein [Coniella lustricola]